MTELEIREIEKVKRKIPKWFQNGGQINSKILIAFMRLSNKNTKPILIQDLVNSDLSIDIRKNYQEMKEIYEKNHAKVFDENSNGAITLWQPVADFICNEYDKWLGGGTIINTPIPPTIITQTTITRTTPPLNQILYGPPGTGKTYSTIDKALEILRHYDKTIEIPESREDKRKIFDEYRANKQIEFVTFHQSFSYEEFVEGIKPKLIDSSEGAESSEMSYTIKSGIFKEICKSALDEQTKPYILIIDEINRGNISKILGELITLIEPSKRIGSDEELRVTLPYSNDSFGVPSNLYIIGTMNTADRSIALLDTALRRRFEFVEMMPNAELLEKIKVENSEIDLQELLTKMNERIEFLLDREHTIGHSFFIGVDSLDRLCEAFKLKIIPLLQEYFYDDYAKIQAVLNDNDMIKAKPKPEFLSKFSDEVNDEKVVYEIEKEWQKWESWQFVKIYNSRATKSQNQDFGESSENEQE